MLSVDVSSVLTARFSVATVSQPPLVFINVSLYVPPAVYGLPFHVNGSWLAQTVVFSVDVSSALTVRFSVAIVSQPPLVFINVSIYVPPAVYGLPFHIYGSWLAQTVVLSVDVSSALTVRFSVANVSQPPLVFINVSTYVPPVLYGLPFHIYGSWLAQTVVLSVDVSSVLTARFSVAIVSHPPDVFINVSTYVPPAVYGLPFHIYGSWLPSRQQRHDGCEPG